MRKSRDAHLERNARKAAEHFIYIGHLFFVEDYQVVQIPLVRLSVEDFVRPVSIAMRSHFLTVTAAGKGGPSHLVSRHGQLGKDPECAHPIFRVTS